MISFTHDSSVGNATVRACSATRSVDPYTGPGNGLPGFLSITLAVPSSCRSWSLSASGGYIDFRSVDANYASPPPTRHTYHYAATHIDIYPDPDANRYGDSHVYIHTDHDFYAHGDLYAHGYANTPAPSGEWAGGLRPVGRCGLVQGRCQSGTNSQ